MVINYKIILIVIVLAIIISIILTQYNTSNTGQGIDSKKSQKFFNFNIETKNADLIELRIDSIFKISGVRDEYVKVGNIENYSRLYFELDKNNQLLYDELKNADEKTVVVYPIFTAIAYSELGFYNYFREECDSKCLTLPIKPVLDLK